MKTGTWRFSRILPILFVVQQAEADVPDAYRQVAELHAIPPAIFYAIALTESGKSYRQDDTTKPWPWTLNIEGEGFYFDTRVDAVRAIQTALSRNQRSIDIGLMQVNWRYHHTALRDPWQALDPWHNLEVAADILKTCYTQGRDWWQSVGCYHAPNHAGRARAYRGRVERWWRRLGMGDQ